MELTGIPASNIWNYDESNLQDDPGSKKVLVKRGAKHPELIKNATKASISIMMCGNAAGTLAPVYVTYKAEGMYSCWMEGGPPGTRYNRSSSGWFDGRIFEDWFEYLMLPILRRQEGTKVLIGDNLSSHISARVLVLCDLHNIKFIALPPHSTHLLQPLDVAFFRPVKGAWRSILSEWKETQEGRKLATIPKFVFPSLLNDLLMKLEDHKKNNLISGFKACGIYPVNREPVLRKMSDSVFQTAGEHITKVSDAFLEELKHKRIEIAPKVTRRKKKVNVPPGKGITYDDLADTLLEQVQQQSSGTSERKRKNTQSSKGKAKQRKRNQESSSEEDEDDVVSYADSEDSFGSLFNELTDTDNNVHTTRLLSPPRTRKYQNSSQKDEEERVADESATIEHVTDITADFNLGDFVAVSYLGRIYPGKIITNFDESGEACVSCMVKKGKHWVWPEKGDEIWYTRDQIIKKLSAPKKIGNDEVFLVDVKR